MAQAVVYEGAPHRVILGAGLATRLPEELARLGLAAPFLVSTAGQAARARDYLHGLALAGGFAEAAMHTPVTVTERAVVAMAGAGADCVVSFGGGSSTGLGKAIAVRTGLPLIAIGTTYGGSEMTALLGETADGIKATRRDPRVLPTVTAYDVELTLSLPPATSAASGVNAIAHAVEALYSRDANPIVSLIALDAIATLAAALPRIVADMGDRTARTDALRGACEAGLSLNAVSMGLHHRLCHILGGAFDLPHAETHAVVLPHAMAYNQPAIPDVAARIAAALGAADAASGLFDIVRALAPARSLQALGMPADGIDHVTDLAMASGVWSPRPLERGAVRALLARAWAGEAPR
jgi:alcohol dehydrogenase class IV